MYEYTLGGGKTCRMTTGYCLLILQNSTCKSHTPIIMKSTIKYMLPSWFNQLLCVCPGICLLCNHEIDGLRLLLSFAGPLFCEILYWRVLIQESIFIPLFTTHLYLYSLCSFYFSNTSPYIFFFPLNLDCSPLGQYTSKQRLVFLR